MTDSEFHEAATAHEAASKRVAELHEERRGLAPVGGSAERIREIDISLNGLAAEIDVLRRRMTEHRRPFVERAKALIVEARERVAPEKRTPSPGDVAAQVANREAILGPESATGLRRQLIEVVEADRLGAAWDALWLSADRLAWRREGEQLLEKELLSQIDTLTSQAPRRSALDRLREVMRAS